MWIIGKGKINIILIADLAAVVAVGRVVVIREVGLDRVVVVVAAGETGKLIVW